MRIERNGLNIRIVSSSEGYIETQSVEALLLSALLDKLEEIRCGIIDLEIELNVINSKTGEQHDKTH